MADRPYTLLSCGMSLDGYLDDASDERLLLSNDADFDRVDEVRAGCDAILVGAATVRNDDPRLLVRDPERVARRRAAGLPAQPLKVTVTDRAKLDPEARFFTAGDGREARLLRQRHRGMAARAPVGRSPPSSTAVARSTCAG